MNSRLLALFALISVLVAVAPASSLARGRDSDTRIPGRYIVVFKDAAVSEDNEDTTVDDMVGKRHLKHEATFRSALRGMVVQANDADIAAVKSDPRVDFVSPDYPVSIEGFRSESVRTVTPASVQSLPTGIDRIDAENKTNKGAGVNVAVIDTGIDTSHPDLKANIAGGKNCSTGGTNNYTDGNGHGTHVAGTIAGINNTTGVVGVAPAAKLWAVRVLDNTGSGTWSSVICGIDFVTSKSPKYGGPITVANMSLGGAGVSDNNCGKTNNDALHQAICRSRDAGVTYVVAAGNSGADAATFVPGAYNDAVITVSALSDSDGRAGGIASTTNSGYGPDDTFATFSNYGAAVDLGAPGVDIYSTWKGGGYQTLSGTSMASPHVAGAAALYIAGHRGASWTTVRDALIALGEKLGGGHTDPSGTHPEPVVSASKL